VTGRAARAIEALERELADAPEEAREGLKRAREAARHARAKDLEKALKELERSLKHLTHDRKEKPLPKPDEVRGTVVVVDADARTITLRTKDGESDYRLSEDVVIKAGPVFVTPRDLKPGQPVKASLRGPRTVIELKLEKKPEEERPR
jgi:hypothetical protein